MIGGEKKPSRRCVSNLSQRLVELDNSTIFPDPNDHEFESDHSMRRHPWEVVARHAIRMAS
jgi:hypothetical protein